MEKMCSFSRWITPSGLLILTGLPKRLAMCYGVKKKFHTDSVESFLSWTNPWRTVGNVSENPLRSESNFSATRDLAVALYLVDFITLRLTGVIRYYTLQFPPVTILLICCKLTANFYGGGGNKFCGWNIHLWTSPSYFRDYRGKYKLL